MHYDPYYEPHNPIALNCKQHIALVGFSGSQTHQVAAFLSSMMGMTFIEVDQWVAHQAGCSIAQLYLEKGEHYWRDLEQQCLQKAFRNKPYAIITLGQESLSKSSNLSLCLKKSRLFYVRKSAQQLFDSIVKMRRQAPQRFPYWLHTAPQSEQEIQKRLNQVQPFYEQAHDCIESNHLAPLAIARKIMIRITTST